MKIHRTIAFTATSFAIALAALGSTRAHEVVPPVDADRCHTHVVAAGDEPERHCHGTKKRKHDPKKALRDAGVLGIGVVAAWLIAREIHGLDDDTTALRLMPHVSPDGRTGIAMEHDLFFGQAVGFRYDRPGRPAGPEHFRAYWRISF